MAFVREKGLYRSRDRQGAAGKPSLADYSRLIKIPIVIDELS